MDTELEKSFTIEDNIVLLKVFIDREEPLHSCGECGIPTSFPGLFCEVCSEDLAIDGTCATRD